MEELEAQLESEQSKSTKSLSPEVEPEGLRYEWAFLTPCFWGER